jgi:hypothetical protein
LFPYSWKKALEHSIPIGVVVRAVNEERTMKSALILAAAGLTLTASVAAAQDARVGVGPVGAGVTVGQSPSYERRTRVTREREPRDDNSVVIRKERREPREKTIIHERD